MLSEEQRADFDQSGVVALREAVQPQAAAEMAEFIWRYLNDRGIAKDAPDAPSRILPSKVRNAVKQRSFDSLWGEPIREVINSILGADRWKVPGHAGQLLDRQLHDARAAPAADGHAVCPICLAHPRPLLDGQRRQHL